VGFWSTNRTSARLLVGSTPCCGVSARWGQPVTRAITGWSGACPSKKPAVYGPNQRTRCWGRQWPVCSGANSLISPGSASVKYPLIPPVIAYRHRMRYVDLQARNVPIGSGVVEAACKTLVSQRLKDVSTQRALTAEGHCLQQASMMSVLSI
jgi:hypothetical protein